MHEYSIVGALVDRVDQIAAATPGAIVRTLRVRIGDLAGVEVPLLRTAFETFRAHTVCEHAELVIEPVAAEWRCPRCGRTIAPGEVLRCCAPARLVAGDDIVLDRVELEVPDV